MDKKWAERKFMIADAGHGAGSDNVPAAHEAGSVTKEAGEGLRGRVLVMDDDEMMRLISQKIFTHLHFAVDLAEEGGQAVELVRRAVEEKKEYGVILLDLRVIRGMHGVDAARRIWEMWPQACLVAMSGDHLDPVMTNYGDYHFHAILPKPFTIEAVRQLLREIYPAEVTT